MKEKTEDKRKSGHGGKLRLPAEELVRKPRRGGTVDELSLESRRRAIAYGRARGNA